MAPLSPAVLLVAAAILVMLGIGHSTLVQTPLQSVSLPASSTLSFRPLPGHLMRDVAPLWRLHTRRLDGRVRSKYTPKGILGTNHPSLTKISSSYGTNGFGGSLSRVSGNPAVGPRHYDPSRTKVLQRLESGRQPEERQLLRNRLLDILSKYREHQRRSDLQLLEDGTTKDDDPISGRSNYKNLNDAFYKFVMAEIISGELSDLLQEAQVEETLGNRERVLTNYPDLPESLAFRDTFKNNLLSPLPSNSLDYVQTKLEETENILGSQNLENTNGMYFPSWEDNLEGPARPIMDLIIVPQPGRINSVHDTHAITTLDADRNETGNASPKIQKLPKNIVPGHTSDISSDFESAQDNEQKLIALRERIPEEEVESSPTNLPENDHVLKTSEEPAQKDNKTFLKLKDLVMFHAKIKDKQSLSSRGRRSLAEKEEAALHAEECHGQNLRACGQPAMKKLLKGSDMKTKCRVREEFLNCMGEKRFLPCPSSPPAPTGSKVHPFDDPVLRDLRKSLRKELATTCIFGYSLSEDAAPDI